MVQSLSANDHAIRQVIILIWLTNCLLEFCQLFTTQAFFFKPPHYTFSIETAYGLQQQGISMSERMVQKTLFEIVWWRFFEIRKVLRINPCRCVENKTVWEAREQTRIHIETHQALWEKAWVFCNNGFHGKEKNYIRFAFLVTICFLEPISGNVSTDWFSFV